MMLTRYLIFIIIVIPGIRVHAQEAVWLLVDTERLSLEVKQNNITMAKFENISIGRNGSGFKRFRGDDITPIGSYTIGWINRDSDYRLFFGFDYPTEEQAKKALDSGLIKKGVYQAIVKAHHKQQLPPQNTPLGGRIGIHGLGKADPEIHRIVNWTHGCIALTNEQIDQLDKWIIVGTPVVVR